MRQPGGRSGSLGSVPATVPGLLAPVQAWLRERMAALGKENTAADVNECARGGVRLQLLFYHG
jgi:hypothetical protein